MEGSKYGMKDDIKIQKKLKVLDSLLGNSKAGNALKGAYMMKMVANNDANIGLGSYSSVN